MVFKSYFKLALKEYIEYRRAYEYIHKLILDSFARFIDNKNNKNLFAKISF